MSRQRISQFEWQLFQWSASCRQSSSWSVIIHPLLRVRISCSSGPHQHCTILKNRENFTFTVTLPGFHIVFYLAFTKERDLKEIKPKRFPWTHHTHIRTTHSVISFMLWMLYLHGKIPLYPMNRRLVGPRTDKLL